MNANMVLTRPEISAINKVPKYSTRGWGRGEANLESSDPIKIGIDVYSYDARIYQNIYALFR